MVKGELETTLTSWRPPEQAKERGVSLVLSDWASMSPPLSSSTSTTPTCPAVAAKIRGVKPGGENEGFFLFFFNRLKLYKIFHFRLLSCLKKSWKVFDVYLFCPGVQYWPPVQWEQIQVPHVLLHTLASALCHGCSPSGGEKKRKFLSRINEWVYIY